MEVTQYLCINMENDTQTHNLLSPQSESLFDLTTCLVDQSECVCAFDLEELHGVDLWSCFGFGSTEF